MPDIVFNIDAEFLGFRETKQLTVAGKNRLASSLTLCFHLALTKRGLSEIRRSVLQSLCNRP